MEIIFPERAGILIELTLHCASIWRSNVNRQFEAAGEINLIGRQRRMEL